MIDNKKSTILLILKVLEEYSDEDHYLTQQDIIDKISDAYRIELERKSVAFSISLLQELDYDIIKSPRGGYALLSRLFDTSEIRFITDALISSKSLSEHQANMLSKKVNSCLSKYQRKNYNFIHKTTELNRFENKELFYIIDTIEEAKKEGKRVSFQYISFNSSGKPYVKNDGYRYIVSPYFTVNSNGRYYLVCNYREKYRPIQSFRIDYMTNIKIENEWNVKPLNSFKGMKDFNITKYLNEQIYMLSGDSVFATFEIEDDRAIPVLIDWFGDNVRIYKNNKNASQRATIVCNENALFYWCMQYSEMVKVTSPQSLIDRIKKEAERIIKRYEVGN